VKGTEPGSRARSQGRHAGSARHAENVLQARPVACRCHGVAVHRKRRLSTAATANVCKQGQAFDAMVGWQRVLPTRSLRGAANEDGSVRDSHQCQSLYEPSRGPAVLKLRRLLPALSRMVKCCRSDIILIHMYVGMHPTGMNSGLYSSSPATDGISPSLSTNAQHSWTGSKYQPQRPNQRFSFIRQQVPPSLCNGIMCYVRTRFSQRMWMR
jgi:hypothetical protein